MEEKVRYQYSYFIYPFKVKSYEKYIYSLLKSKDITVELLDKEKNMEIYTYFLPSIRQYYFGSIEWKNEQRKAFETMEDGMKRNILSQMGACFFTYPIENQIHGKIGQGDIFFTIDNINIVCTKSKNCFLLLKTHIENAEKMDQVIDFNYKFREINTIGFKDYDKIRIQATQFESAKDIKTLIKEITKQEDVSLPYVYSYLCIDSECWNTARDFENLQTSFKKYINLQANHSKSDLKLLKELLLDEDYIKMATSKGGTFIMASSLQSENYTKLPYFFEKQYLYTYLIRLEQKEVLNSSFENKGNIQKWASILARDEVTNDELGNSFYNKLREVWDLDALEKRAKEYEEILFQKEEISKNKRWNRILMIILAISIMLNICNLIMNLKIF